MDIKIKNYLGIAIISSLVFFALATVVCLNIYHNSIPASSLRSFTVAGEGEVIAVPDVATFNFSVVTQGGMDVGVLQEDNSIKANRAIDFLKNKEIETKDIKTQYYNISPRYAYVDCPEFSDTPCFGREREIIGYTVTQTVFVKVRDFSKTGELLSGVVREGANSVSNLSFTIDDTEPLQNEARVEAISKAKEKARAMARIGGFRLGRIISIQERTTSPAYRSLQFAEDASASMVKTDPFVEAGSQEVSINVSVTYEIK